MSTSITIQHLASVGAFSIEIGNWGAQSTLHSLIMLYGKPNEIVAAFLGSIAKLTDLVEHDKYSVSNPSSNYYIW